MHIPALFGDVFSEKYIHLHKLIIMEENELRTDDVNQLNKSSRSSSYPSQTVVKSFDFASKINAQFSTVAEVSREEIAKALDVNAGSIIRDISSCVQYGFLKKNTSEGKYKLTDLFTDIFRQDSERDKKIAYIKAFGLPKLNNELISKFENNIVPNELRNTLIKSHNIREEVSDIAAEIFIESGKQAGVINENRVLKYAITLSTLEKSQAYTAVVEDAQIIENGRPDVKNQLMPITLKSNQKNISIPIHLVGAKVAMFIYPDDLNEDDIEIIKYQIEGILLRIKLSNKKRGTVENSESKNE